MKALRYAILPFFLAVPIVALAQTTSNSSLSSLLAELSALEQQINAITAASTTASAPAVSVPSSAANAPVTTNLCPDLSRTLSLGQSGADVAGLQEFLAQQGVFHGVVSAYFGIVTQSSVAQWQEANGVVSGGNAASTGLGVVGPKTRAAMESLCQGAPASPSQSQCIHALPPSTECPTNWRPVFDHNGCTEYYQCSISLPTAGSGATSTTATTTNTCPVAQKPTCSGTVQTYQTASGCQAYECVL